MIGDECIIGANALVTSMTEIPPRSVVMGLPGKVVRHNDMSIREKAERSALSLCGAGDQYLQGRFPRRQDLKRGLGNPYESVHAFTPVTMWRSGFRAWFYFNVAAALLVSVSTRDAQ